MFGTEEYERIDTKGTDDANFDFGEDNFSLKQVFNYYLTKVSVYFVVTILYQ